MAGFRTNVLVSMGAFLFVILSMVIEGETSPTRIAAQIVSGIGFLGGGVIIRDGLSVSGLNSAATLWCSAAIGVLTASGLLLEGTIGTLLVLLSNIFLRTVPKNLEILNYSKFNEFGGDEVEPQHDEYNLLRIACDSKEASNVLSNLTDMCKKEDLEILKIEMDSSKNYLNHDETEIAVKIKSKQELETNSQISSYLHSLVKVKYVSFDPVFANEINK